MNLLRVQIIAPSIAAILAVNWLLTIPTRHFIELAQHHIDHTANLALLAASAFVALFLTAALLLLTVKRNEVQKDNERRQLGTYITIAAILLVNTSYWFLAFLNTDSACIKCGGFSTLMYFWLN